MASKFFQALRVLSPSSRKKRIGSITEGYHLRVCGPEEIIKSLRQTFEASFSKQAAGLETLNMGKIQGLVAGWARLSVTSNDAFVLAFYMDDEDSFQAIAAFRDVIMAAKSEGLNIPVLVVGFDRKETPRSIRRVSVERLVTLTWGHIFTEAPDASSGNLEKVFEEMFKVICDTHTFKAGGEQQITTL